MRRARGFHTRFASSDALTHSCRTRFAKPCVAALGLFGALFAWEGESRASTAIEYPDNGVAQFSRGGAWLATATDPLAAFYNPAALATQPTSLGIGFNLPMQKICYQRKGPGGADSYADPSLKPPPDGTDADPYEEVCNEHSNFPRFIPNLAFNWRVNESLAIGIAINPPASYGTLEWPLFGKTTSRIPVTSERPVPAAQRYLSTKVEGTILMPTLSFGYAITDSLRVGAGFISGIAILDLNAVSMSTVAESRAYDEFNNDNLSELHVKDLFIPGFVVSTHYSATDNLEVAGWFKWLDRIKAKGDADITAVLNRNGAPARICSQAEVDAAIQAAQDAGQETPDLSCSVTTHSEDEVGKDKVHVNITVPMEGRLGLRYHEPAPRPTPLELEHFRKDDVSVRDPLRDDVYDVELNLTWANNSAADNIEVRFTEQFQPVGVPGLTPANADRPTGWKDTFGARLGGQYNVLRNRLGLRAGTWVETSAVDDEYLNVTGVPALRGGFGGGFVARFGHIDIEAGYQHIWNAGLDNGGDGKLKAIAGAGNDPANRSFHAVNGGSITQHANVFSIGGVARF